LRRIEPLRELTHLRTAAYDKGNELIQTTFSDLRHEPLQNVGYGRVQLHVRMFTRVDTLLADLAVDTGLPQTRIILVCLAAGLAQSVDFLKENYVQRLAGYVIDFIRYCDARVSLARKLIM